MIYPAFKVYTIFCIFHMNNLYLLGLVLKCHLIVFFLFWWAFWTKLIIRERKKSDVLKKTISIYGKNIKAKPFNYLFILLSAKLKFFFCFKWITLHPWGRLICKIFCYCYTFIKVNFPMYTILLFRNTKILCMF